MLVAETDFIPAELVPSPDHYFNFVGETPLGNRIDSRVACNLSVLLPLFRVKLTGVPADFRKTSSMSRAFGPLRQLVTSVSSIFSGTSPLRMPALFAGLPLSTCATRSSLHKSRGIKTAPRRLCW